MRGTRLIAALAALTLILTFGCSQQRATNPSVKDNVSKSLETAGFKDINVDEDRDKGVITIKGKVGSQDDKTRAEDIARQAAGNSVVANELLVTGANEDRAEDVASATDDAIEAEFDAMIEKANLKDQHINKDAKNGVLTLTGDVDTAAQRASIEKNAAKIKGVTQVVNKLEVKNAKR
ncbi:MAG TPA: BON domain-containing protein [Terriglobales bacterium]|nr:BON domain-containing protein [Terriglobales bacterium]